MDEYQLPTAHATILSESTLLVDYFNFYVYLALHAELFELAHLHSFVQTQECQRKGRRITIHKSQANASCNSAYWNHSEEKTDYYFASEMKFPGILLSKAGAREAGNRSSMHELNPDAQRRNQKFWIRGAEQILYTIREKHIKIYIRVTNILDRENALHMFCLHFTTSQTYCEFVFSFFHKIISNVFVFLVWPCFLKKIITYSLRPTKSVVLGNFRHITYLNKWLCYP